MNRRKTLLIVFLTIVFIGLVQGIVTNLSKWMGPLLLIAIAFGLFSLVKHLENSTRKPKKTKPTRKPKLRVIEGGKTKKKTNRK